MRGQMYYDLAADTWGDEEKTAIQEVVESGRFTMGPRVAQFEQAFAEYFGRKHAVMVNSGSSANLVGVASLFPVRTNPQREMRIVPAISWSTTYYPLQQYGLKLRFVDVELGTQHGRKPARGGVDLQTRMIVAVNILGQRRLMFARLCGCA